MMVSRAITRQPSRNFASGLTTQSPDLPPDYNRMRKQHQAYVETLRSIGLEVIVMPPEPGYPDAHFVEDTAVITPDVAVITNPGAVSRRGETDSIEAILEQYRPIRRIHAPGTLDGGDVLMLDSHVFIGLSERTNPSGGTQLGHILEAGGYSWSLIPVGDGLHFKSSVNLIAPNTLLVAENFPGREQLQACKLIAVPEDEAYAANTLWINNHLLIPAGYPKVCKKLAVFGYPIIELDVSEVQKMDGGLTCLSLRF
jgi:dimethylargininase